MVILHAREEWTARQVPNPAPVRNVATVFVHHEGGGVRGNPADKPAVLREIESFVLAKGYSAIDYNLMVFQDGSIWEGRGLDHEDAATLNWNAKSVSVCAVGNFERETPTPALLTGIAEAIQLARFGGWLTGGSAILGHRDSGFSTACPGAHLYAELGTIRAQANGTITATEEDMPLNADDIAKIGAEVDARENRVIGTLQANMKNEWIPAIVGGVLAAVKPLLKDPAAVNADEIVAEIGKKLTAP